jgi:hypothetical protein
MSRVEHIEGQVKSLSQDELKAFRDWFGQFDAQAWDDQIEADAKNGKLRSLAERALQDRSFFDVKAPNATTRKAIAELEAGKGKRFTSTKALMADLNTCARSRTKGSSHMQGRSVGAATVRLHDDLNILIQRHEEAEKTFDGELTEFAAQHLRYVRLTNSK